MDFHVILFDGFETLDAFGPVEVFSKLEERHRIEYYSGNGGIVRSSQNCRQITLPMAEAGENGVLILPGGMGTRIQVENEAFIRQVWDLSEKSRYVLTICTGSALLAKTGLLDGHKATTNKRAFDWVVSQNEKVTWIKKARWVVDGKYYTSSGVSAGMDMALGFVNGLYGGQAADRISRRMEYIWNRDKDEDPFS